MKQFKQKFNQTYNSDPQYDSITDLMSTTTTITSIQANMTDDQLSINLLKNIETRKYEAIHFSTK
jgi:hypothetical protein